jgi:putative ABC transport system ATP-binding protein
MTQPLIELTDIWRTYATGRVAVSALKGVSFTIRRGEMVAIMGPSGSGKTTMMNILGCLDRPSSGHYRLAGDDVSTLDADALADIRNARLGFVFQGYNLLARTTALDNVALPLLYGPPCSAAQRTARAQTCLARVGLGERSEHQPNELSGGEQQRVAIARALVNNPPLVLADEPTGNLDTQRSEEILALFQALNQDGLTVVMVTHEPDIAACCHRVLRFRDGCLVADDPVVTRWLVPKSLP